MEQRYAGRSGLRVSSLGLGTMTWGQETDADTAATQLYSFRDAGGTLVDTAASYGAGRAETILGALLAGSRHEVVISTKAGVDLHGGPDGSEPSVDASRGALLSQLEGSLRRLRIDFVDLWQVHRVDPNVSAEETLSALDHAVASGKARYVGVSNYPGWRLAQAATGQAAAGRAPVVVNQVEYSLLARGVEREVVPASVSLGIGLLCYSPLGGGVLTGKYRAATAPPARAVAAGRGAAAGTGTAGNLGAAATPGAAGSNGGSAVIAPRALGIVEAVATAAEGLATSPLAVALSWVQGRPGVTSAVVGARTAAQLNATLQARALQLPEAIRHALDEVSAPEIGYPEDAG